MSEEIQVTNSEDNKIDMFKEHEGDDQYWMIVMFILSLMDDYKTHKSWNEFAKEIKHKNRFFPKSSLIKRIEEFADKAIYILEEGETLYRARDYSEANYKNNRLFSYIIKELKNECSLVDIDENEENIFDETVINLITIELGINEEKSKVIKESLKTILEEQKPFYGYSKGESDAPPSSRATAGRANPKGISYLYAAKDIKTAILEMRPQRQKAYSVGKIIITTDVKLFDLAYGSQITNEDSYKIYAELRRISKEFSKPNFGDTMEYMPTQFISEYIYNLGFGGIRYKSAVDEDGYNILLFDTSEETRAYDIVGSEIYSVDSLDVKYSQVLPIVEEL